MSLVDPFQKKVWLISTKQRVERAKRQMQTWPSEIDDAWDLEKKI